MIGWRKAEAGPNVPEVEGDHFPLATRQAAVVGGAERRALVMDGGKEGELL